MTDFRTAAEALRETMVARRRDLHQHPELAFRKCVPPRSWRRHYAIWGWKCTLRSGRRAWWGCWKATRTGRR